MSNAAEKLVYLQNGVFKRKELSDGLQYYSGGSFNTLATPEAEGNYLLTIGDNNALSWSQQGDSLTSLSNSFFKDSNSQAITIATQGTIPYFTSNSTFGELDLPSSGKYVLNMDEDGNPSFSTFDESRIFTALDIGNPLFPDIIVKWNSITSTCSTLYLPNQSGTYILTAENDEVLGGTSYNFSTLNASTLFHDTLGVQSTNLCLIAYKGNSAFGVNVPAMNNSSGYFVFKNETNTEVPTTSVLDASTIYQDIFGCTSTEKCLVYNDGSNVSKLTLPTTSGSYLLNVSSNGGVTLSPPTAKLSKTFNYSWGGSGHSVVNEGLTSSDTDLTGDIMLSSNSKYLLTLDLVLKCGNYEQAFVGFTNTPTLTIDLQGSTVLKGLLDNPVPSLHVSGSSIISSSKDGALRINIVRTGDTTISHTYSHFQVTVVEL